MVKIVYASGKLTIGFDARKTLSYTLLLLQDDLNSKSYEAQEKNN